MNKSTPYEIINTEASDLEVIYWLFDQAIYYQKKNNYPFWPDYDKDVLKKDIYDRRQFKILLEGSIVCIFSICYSDIVVWRERDNKQSIYLHRVVTHPKFKGRKLFQKVLYWAIDYSRENRIKFIRMDTWADNPTLVSYYQSFNFNIVDFWTTPNSKELPIQQRGNEIVLLEYEVKQITY